jgi:ornithine cyclodeaminase/alanine dehydrogenase-like protein (mu-crystallin family)
MPAPPTLLLSRARISQLATPEDYISAVRSAFADMAEGRIEVASVGHVSGIAGAFHIKAAGRTVAPAFAVVKVNGNFPENAGRYQLPTIQGLIALLDAERGCVLALMDTIEITARRTAAATAIAAQYLANPDAHTLGVIGCGVQARYHVEALSEVAAIESVLFYDLNTDAADAFEAYLQSAGLQAKRVPDARAACEGAGIVVTLTPSTRPILALTDVAPGTFVAGVGADNPHKHELAPDLLRASHVVVDSLLQAPTMGDLHHAVISGEMSAGAVYSELADLVVGKVAGRRAKAERWVFDSTGLAIQDLAAAAMVYELARANEAIPRMQFND